MLKHPLRLSAIGLLLITAVLFMYTDKQEDRHRATTLPYIQQMLSDISDWQAESLSPYLSSAAKQTINPQQLANAIAQYRPLGRFIDIEHLAFSRLASALSLLGQPYIAYQGSLKFEKGYADVTVTLIKENQQWLIANINLSPQQ